MILNKRQIEQYFKEWNEKAFEGKLPTPVFDITRSKGTLGQYSRTYYFCEEIHIIRISMFYDRPLKDIINTLVHEMLHFYIYYMGIKDSSSHGPVWRFYANDLNKKFGLNITRTSYANGEANKRYLTKKQSNKMEWVIVAETTAGNCCACVIPNKLDIFENFKRRMNNWDLMKRYKIIALYGDETFDLPHVRTKLSLTHISKERFQKLWDANCIKLEVEVNR